MNAMVIFISCQDKTEAERISELLLKEKLAACCTISSSVNSIFLWPPGKGQLDYADECLLIVKTLETKWEALEERVLAVHSYDNPEILALPVVHGSKKYISWMEHELSK